MRDYTSLTLVFYWAMGGLGGARVVTTFIWDGQNIYIQKKNGAGEEETQWEWTIFTTVRWQGWKVSVTDG